MDQPTCPIDGFGPLPVEQPSTVAELGEIVRLAAGEGSALYPVGGRTQLDLGMPPVKQGRAVDLRRLDGVIDFPARDMTVTVQAGIGMARLRAALAAERLRLPIDVAAADRATLGGVLATNTSGPRRLGYGTPRDYLIGVSAVNDEGHEFKAGGRVVKNVAGYDLCKLLVGSLGTLGIITQATLKLRPLAEEQALVSLPCEAESLEALLAKVHGSRTRPVCVDLLNRPAVKAVFARAGLPTPDVGWTLLVGYEGNADAVNWQVQQLVKELGVAQKFEARVGFTAQPLWEALVEWAQWPDGNLAFKANLLPSAVASFCQHADTLRDSPHLRAHAASGIVVGQWPAGLTTERAAGVLAAWRDRAASAEGRVIVQRCPAAWKSALSVWGPAPADAWLMRAVKEQFDPRRVFNPGRFVDGI
jgi:glycolate oxidase FAD binding subunit